MALLLQKQKRWRAFLFSFLEKSRQVVSFLYDWCAENNLNLKILFLNGSVCINKLRHSDNYLN